MASEYEPIWNQIKATGVAEVTCSREKSDTLIRMVKKVKTIENTGRKMAGLMGWSRLVIEQRPLDKQGNMVRIKFSLYYETLRL